MIAELRSTQLSIATFWPAKVKAMALILLACIASGYTISIPILRVYRAFN